MDWKIALIITIVIAVIKNIYDNYIYSTRKSDLREIYRHFGRKNQIEKLKEEVNEVIEAIEKEDPIEHIAEELADVHVLLEQLRVAYNIKETEIADVMEEKIQRTLERIENGYYDKHQ